MVLIAPSRGQTILHTHISQFTNLIGGVANNGQAVALTQHSDAVNYANVLGNADATNGLALKVQYGPAATPTTIATFAKAGVSFTAPLLFGNGSVSAPSVTASGDPNTGRYWSGSDVMADAVGGEEALRFTNGAKFPQLTIGGIAPYTADIALLINRTMGATDGDVVLTSTELVTNATSGGGGTVPDSGAFRAVVYNSLAAANNAIRAGEFQTLRRAGAGAHADALCWGIEVGVHSESVGNTFTKTVGVSVYSNDWPDYTAVRADTGVYIWGGRGWEHLLYALDTDATTVLADLNKVGTLKLNPVGTAAAPSYAFVGRADQGMFSLSSSAVAFAAGGAEQMRLDTNGIASGGATIAGRRLSIYGNARFMSNGAASNESIEVGRTGVDATLAVSGGSGQFVTGDAQGDAVLKAAQKLMVGIGTTPVLNVLSTGVVFPLGTTNQGVEIVDSAAFITPAQLTANTDNWNPTGLSTARVIRASTDISRNLTGLVAQAAGRVITIMNVGAFDLVVKHEVTSTAANRFNTANGADLTINPSGAAKFIYDGTATRWKVFY